MPALALISDLVVQSQVSGAATRAGTTVEVVASAEALLAKAETMQPNLVILDLSHAGLDPGQLLPLLKERIPQGATTLAFGPHVHHERLRAATDAGCDLVISRGQFHAQAEEILRRYAAG
jgi:DNA-binding NarL/FixJ family response regulator